MAQWLIYRQCFTAKNISYRAIIFINEVTLSVILKDTNKLQGSLRKYKYYEIEGFLIFICYSTIFKRKENFLITTYVPLRT